MPVTPDLSRRALLRGRVHVEPTLRPPWALDEPAFLQACTRCRACIDACPEHVLSLGDGGFPAFEPIRGECTFCGRCATACEPGALQCQAGVTPWQIAALVSDGDCLAQRGVICLSCQDACGERAISFPLTAGRVATPKIDTDRCTGCGACVSTCPTTAISLKPGLNQGTP